MPTPRIDLIYFDAGGGHRAAATALQAIIAAQKRSWDVRLVNLNDILLPIDILRKLTGLGLQDIYNLILKKGWTLGSRQMLPVMHGLIRLYHGRQVQLIERFWRGEPPALAVSVVPNFNRAILQGLRRVSASTPFVTILTDLADFPPHFWIERQTQYLICGSTRAVEQARALGHSPEFIFRVSGMILRPAFHDTPPADRAAGRRRLGLEPDRPTGLVLFGGHGAPVMLDIVRSLSRLAHPPQLMLMCGHNEALAARLRAMETPYPKHVQGFTPDVPRFMQMADFMIGKPGPGSISEALQMKLPVIVERNAWTLPQERYNADWILDQGAGIVLPSFRGIGPAVERLLQPGELDRYRQRTAGIRNQAVFEIPDILAQLLEHR